jgi:hypothetical protein
MKRLVLPIVLATILAWVPLALSMTVGSDFGFEIKLPANWTAVSKNDVKSKPDMVKATFEAADKDKTFLDLPREFFAKLKEKIAGGEVEYYYKSGSPSFNISVYEDAGTIVQSGSDVKETCSLLSDELSKVTKKPIKVHECRSRQLGNVNALYLVVDAYRQGDKYIQYLIQKSPNRILMLTAASPSGKDFEMMKSEFDDIMESFKLM